MKKFEFEETFIMMLLINYKYMMNVLMIGLS